MTSAALAIALALGGLALGALLAWALLRRAGQTASDAARTTADAELAALRERVASRDAQLADARALLTERDRQISERDAEIRTLAAKLAEFTERLEQERKQSARELEVIERAKQGLSDAFRALSAEALRTNNQSFLETAKTTFESLREAAKGDLEARQKAIGELVLPLKESIVKLDAQAQSLEKERHGAFIGLKEQIQALTATQAKLQTQTGNLVNALQATSTRGRWGEMQLRRVVEMAGMSPYCDFEEQTAIETGSGRQRPDMVIRLPNSRTVVVDAKAPLRAYLEAVEAKDDETKQARLIEHAAHVKRHVEALGAKSYWEQFQPGPEFVVLFLPGEHFFAAALEHAPSLLELGVERGVIIATPTTLIALLKAVHYGWRQEQAAASARTIMELGSELYDRLTKLADLLGNVGRDLGKTVQSYDKFVASFDTRALVSARRLRELGAGSGAELEPAEPVGRVPRAVETQAERAGSAAELPTDASPSADAQSGDVS